MSTDVADPGELQGFGEDAVRAIGLAESEAWQLGHARIGTEHLLLGLLTNDSETSGLLSDAGVTLAAARNKVTEAVGTSSPADTRQRIKPLPRTARASRSLGRALRFAHARGSDVVSSHHLLLGVLDVEGIAGQVLRGLGLDVDALRSSLDAQDARSPSDRRHAAAGRAAALGPARCPACNASLDRGLVSRVVPARDEHGYMHDAVIFTCSACGWFLGAGPGLGFVAHRRPSQ